MLYGAIEAGGTKMVLGIGDENGQILEQLSIPTRAPGETVPEMIAWFKDKGIAALGIASFGPVCLDKNDAMYGCITATPKLAWRNYPILPVLRDALRVKCGFDTDVNAAVLGEARYGAAKGCEDAVYFTVGTGIGAGIISGGKLVHGMQHPEMGHLPLRPVEGDPCPRGFCPYHESCGEGLAAGPAMEKRWGVNARVLPADHAAWKLEARYIAQLCAAALFTLSPRKIILGGGVMGHDGLIESVREETEKLLGGYLTAPGFSDMASLIVRPCLYPVSGLAGALCLAEEADHENA